MKLFFIALFLLTGFAANAQYPRNYTNCKVEYTGNYYYVSKDGQRFSDFTTSLQTAINQQSQMIHSGLCQYSYNTPGACQLEYSGNYYYISRNSARISEFVTDYRSAIQTRDQLYHSMNCDEQTYQSAGKTCAITYSGNYYYVTRNGNRISEFVTNLNQANRVMSDLTNSYVCQAQYPSASCRLEYSGNYYYVSINGARSSEFVTDLNQSLQQQRNLYSSGMCAYQRPESCTVAYSGNYYYVTRSGNRISTFVANMNQASSILQQLRYSQNCY